MEDLDASIDNIFTGIILLHRGMTTVFENDRNCLIQYCERSELRLHFEWTKNYLKCQNWSILVEDAKIEKLKCDILGNFSTL